MRQVIEQRIKDGLVRAQQHPKLPLTIFNYAERVQYEKLWDDVTLQCRGLVMHGDQIVARPFRKFFNDTEHKPEEIPWHLPCEITEKMDGSLGIAFHFAGEWQMATRGSFVSIQAREGRKMLAAIEHRLNPTITYLFEILFPENRIVVNYGDRRELVLLAMIHTQSGVEIPLSEFTGGTKVVRSISPTASTTELRSLIRDDEEGYVVRFANGFRMKVKGQRYLELHRLVSGISSRSVWEWLSEGKSFDELLSVVPDEFAKWVQVERLAMLEAFHILNRRVASAYGDVHDLPTRKEQAIYLMNNHREIASAVFAALDSKPFAPILWKMLYPEMRRPTVDVGE